MAGFFLFFSSSRKCFANSRRKRRANWRFRCGNLLRFRQESGLDRGHFANPDLNRKNIVFLCDKQKKINVTLRTRRQLPCNPFLGFDRSGYWFLLSILESQSVKHFNFCHAYSARRLCQPNEGLPRAMDQKRVYGRGRCYLRHSSGSGSRIREAGG